ncbi:rsbT co-antagonist protein RsbR [Peribacillus deserti]|uniref:RsbT co-antagonist protein RsbR n=1 Tax=Peribacillus deserti TaxID=673318 RepID=A0ABS2QNR4_9BACI|nr:STAS domain-containing protein [Peribacillus deserti]MBM7693911.1 rsbT co-antagonist protein RsbR [Peribacillus deserti]
MNVLMIRDLKYIGEKIIENSQILAKTVADIRITDIESGNKERLSSLIHVDYRTKVFEYLGEALFTDGMETLRTKVSEWSRQAAEIAIHSEFSISDAIRITGTYRTVIWEVFTEELQKRQLTVFHMLEVSKIIDPLLDRIGAVIGEVYEEHNNKLMSIAYSALEELSVPVVPVAEGVAIIPLVGSIDTDRAKLIMEVSLTEGSRLHFKHIILDVSGVPIIDTMVADQLFHIVSALKLTGVETYLTGIRPEIAQTIISLGLNFSEIKTRANMKQALNEIVFMKKKEA